MHKQKCKVRGCGAASDRVFCQKHWNLLTPEHRASIVETAKVRWAAVNSAAAWLAEREGAPPIEGAPTAATTTDEAQ